MLYQLHADFMNQQENYKESAALQQCDIADFIDALYNAPAVSLSIQEQEEKTPDNEEGNIGHLFFEMKDGTTINLTLYQSGYVHYRDMGVTYFYIKDKIYKKIFQEVTS